jgi:UDP-N-acetylmuramoyl-tripeptide--D-alanyl-D-alanine ligase
MQPILLPGGVTVLRDEQNGSPDTFLAALKVLQESNAARRILVMSGISDSKEKPKVRFRKIGRLASQSADLAVFVGEHSHHAAEAARAAGMNENCATNFYDLQKANAYLKSELKRGDFVLLRGRSTDHISRILFAQLGEIGCWKPKCEKTYVCDLCPELKAEFDIHTSLHAI